MCLSVSRQFNHRHLSKQKPAILQLLSIQQLAMYSALTFALLAANSGNTKFTPVRH
ncbi:hypothetical protein COO91_02010 [Nostoc flagelliforme CCNUN1]|uniref:Uncharacterized protein n=1 Tax=Nostoc flagelliforme CCNUN1 TaxID=2038116 RepID=A0A2K8SKZ2_9NOSO|nr:hypothetical protein COO91_02010 [Nostoc flagelliforme CCNUN1]